jgi:transposase
MEGYISMNAKEVDRLKIMDKLNDKHITQKEAAKTLGVSIRQVRRLSIRYKKDGVKGLTHKGRGKSSNHKISEEERSRILTIIKDKYYDFGPTLAHEKLIEQHCVDCGVETIRQIMICSDLWQAKRRKQVKVHPMRERRARVGELVQVDGSPHHWFESRGEACTLLAYIDDASGRIMHLEFAESESTHSYMLSTKHYIEKHGKMVAIYCDKHGVFRVNTSKGGSASVSDSTGRTQFATAMDRLGIEIIFANTPQAKGRVERLNQTLQDRLVKELRLHNISNITQANAFVEEFIAQFNQKFAHEPKDPTNAHSPLEETESLDQIMVIQEQRIISKNLEVHYECQTYQIVSSKPAYSLRQVPVMVVHDLTGKLSILYKNKPLEYRLLSFQKDASVADSKSLNRRISTVLHKERNTSITVPSPDHSHEHFCEKGTFLSGT